MQIDVAGQIRGGVVAQPLHDSLNTSSLGSDVLGDGTYQDPENHQRRHGYLPAPPRPVFGLRGHEHEHQGREDDHPDGVADPPGQPAERRLAGAEQSAHELGRDTDGRRDGRGHQAAEGQGENHRSRRVESPYRADEAMNEGGTRGGPENGADADRYSG